jgi:Zn-dependent peptidase ImmA (M78 family)/DNA-binding XRE family transcriptional regulator
MDEFSPKALQLAREERGLSQSALADAMRFSQGLVSQIENGLMKPSEEFIKKVVEVLRYPRSFFAEPPPYRALPVITFRKQKTLSATTLKAIQARLSIRTAELMRLLKSVDVPENRLPRIAIERRPPSNRPTPSPEEVAQELRLRWHVEPGPVANIIQLVEDAGVLVCRANFGTPKMSGMSDYNPAEARTQRVQKDEMPPVLPPIIYLNAEMLADRARYTVAHELGHLVFHHHLPLPPDQDLCEEEADRFAAEFLMPADEIAGDLERLSLEKLYSLKRYWKVSMHALIHRAEDLEVITPSRARSLYIELAKNGFKMGEPQLFEHEAPSLVTEITQFHLSDLGYSEEQLGEALRLLPWELREIYLGGERRLRVVS